MFKEGGTLLWIAPSGGRDRIDEESGKYEPGVFDPSAVQLIKRLLEKAEKSNRGHVYPMAMASAEIMPPPRGVQKDLGEERVLNHHGVGISLGDEILEADIPGLGDSEDADDAKLKNERERHAFLQAELAKLQGMPGFAAAAAAAAAAVSSSTE